jgi:hypothetical protein
MNSQTKKSHRIIDGSTTTRCIWVTLEAMEVIELKRIAMDRDSDSALTFFWDVLTPRVQAAALQRGVALDMLEKENDNGRISG